MDAFIDRIGLSTHERWREHHLVFDHQTIDRQVVATDLPPPRLDQGRIPKQGEVVTPLTQNSGVMGECAQKMIDSHGVAGFRKPLGGQTACHEFQNRFARPLGQLFEPQSVAIDVHLCVVPASPLPCVKRQAHPKPLLRAQHREHPQGGLVHVFHRRALRLALKEIGQDLPVGGHT